MARFAGNARSPAFFTCFFSCLCSLAHPHCHQVPHCSIGEATIHEFFNNTAPVGLLHPRQQTEVNVCWESDGVQVCDALQ